MKGETRRHKIPAPKRKEQADIPLIGLPPPLPPGIMPSALSKADADRLKAQRDAAIARQS